jgi:hypothetical protein
VGHYGEMDLAMAPGEDLIGQACDW